MTLDDVETKRRALMEKPADAAIDVRAHLAATNNCDECGARSGVVELTATFNGVTRRRLSCVACFHTGELSAYFFTLDVEESR